MSLKKILNERIIKEGYLSIQEIYQICDDLHYKASNAERRLRPSESPGVEAVYDDKGKYIKGYKVADRQLCEIPKVKVQEVLFKFNY
jgi:hypothetical protein